MDRPDASDASTMGYGRELDRSKEVMLLLACVYMCLSSFAPGDEICSHKRPDLFHLEEIPRLSMNALSVFSPVSIVSRQWDEYDYSTVGMMRGRASGRMGPRQRLIV